MVALHPHPTGADLPPAIPDDDLVLALGPTGTLDSRVADTLRRLADDDPADAYIADLAVGSRVHHRPAWSPTRLLGDPLAGAPVAVRARWLRRHGLRPDAPELPYLLARTGADVAHLTAVLTRHDRTPPRPPLAVVDEHLAALGVPATVTPSGELRPDTGFAPEVAVVVPTAGAPLPDGTPAVERLLERLGPLPDRIEVLLVVGDEYQGDPTTLEGPGRRVVHRPPGPFDFSAAIDLGVLRSAAPLVLMLNDDTEPDGTGFLDRMAVHLADPGVAAVGALLTYPDGTVQHDGMVIDDARPLHPFVGWNPVATVPHGGLLAREVIAVTGGCLMLRRRDFLAVGGLSTAFPLSFNDVDLCVRLWRTVGRVVVEPAAALVHHETLTREPVISADEWDRWIHRWGEIVDPWYHPAHHRPDDPHALARNADHLPPRPGDPRPAPTLRRPVLRSRVHRGRTTATRA